MDHAATSETNRRFVHTATTTPTRKLCLRYYLMKGITFERIDLNLPFGINPSKRREEKLNSSSGFSNRFPEHIYHISNSINDNNTS